MPFIRSKVTRIVQPYDTWEHIRRWLTNRGGVADIEVRATPDDDWQDAARHPETAGLLTPDGTYTEQPVPASLPDATDAYPSATPDPSSSEHAVESPDKPVTGAQKTATSSTTVAGRTYSLSAIGTQQTAASATAADVTVHTGPWGTNTHHTGDVFRDAFTSGSGHGPEMVVLPSGSFTMGSPESEAGRHSNEGPQRSVRIGYQLAVGKYEVTFAEWDACVADGGGRDHQPSDAGWGRANRPVINVSWEDAQAYVAWLNQKTGLTGRTDQYRLLSEAEWEYAARAGTQTRWSFGNDESRLGSFAWLRSNSGSRTQPVGGKTANGFGLHDMHGNVWEWVEDCYEHGYSVQPSDGSAFTNGSCSTRVFRGGSWSTPPLYLRSAYRSWDSPGYLNDNLGFRLARTLPSVSPGRELPQPSARTEPPPWPASAADTTWRPKDVFGNTSDGRPLAAEREKKPGDSVPKAPVIDAYRDPTPRNIFSFRGCTRRSGYFLINLVTVPITVFFSTLINEGGVDNLTDNLLLLVVGVASFWVMWATGVRRCRDAGWSGWWVLLALIPWVSLVFGLVLLCVPSSAPKLQPDPRVP